MEKIVTRYINGWCEKGKVMGVSESRKLAFEATASMLLGCDFSQAQMNSMMGCMQVMVENFFTLPIDLPGFGFHKVSQMQPTKHKYLNMVNKLPSEHPSLLNLQK